MKLSFNHFRWTIKYINYIYGVVQLSPLSFPKTFSSPQAEIPHPLSKTSRLPPISPFSAFLLSQGNFVDSIVSEPVVVSRRHVLRVFILSSMSLRLSCVLSFSSALCAVR